MMITINGPDQPGRARLSLRYVGERHADWIWRPHALCYWSAGPLSTTPISSALDMSLKVPFGTTVNEPKLTSAQGPNIIDDDITTEARTRYHAARTL